MEVAICNSGGRDGGKGAGWKYLELGREVSRNKERRMGKEGGREAGEREGWSCSFGWSRRETW